MKILVVSVAVAMSLASCSNSLKDSQVENSVSSFQMGNDTIVDFENTTLNVLPSGCTATATGKPESINWNVVNDNDNNVLAQQSVNEGSCYNLLVLDTIGYKDFTTSVKIKAISGEEDQRGGLVWRYIDKDNYYIARYNPLEKNLRFYRVVDGNRSQLESVDSDIKKGEWFTMTIEMKETKVTCSLNGKTMIESSDDTFKSEGLIGFWTKADAVTYFDDLSITTEK